MVNSSKMLFGKLSDLLLASQCGYCWLGVTSKDLDFFHTIRFVTVAVHGLVPETSVDWITLWDLSHMPCTGAVCSPASRLPTVASLKAGWGSQLYLLIGIFTLYSILPCMRMAVSHPSLVNFKCLGTVRRQNYDIYCTVLWAVTARNCIVSKELYSISETEPLQPWFSTSSK